MREFQMLLHTRTSASRIGMTCTLFASDRVIGDGAEQFEESTATMELENEFSTAETDSGESNKRRKRDCLADVVTSFAESFKKYVSKAKAPLKPTCKEIYEAVSEVEITL